MIVALVSEGRLLHAKLNEKTAQLDKATTSKAYESAAGRAKHLTGIFAGVGGGPCEHLTFRCCTRCTPLVFATRGIGGTRGCAVEYYYPNKNSFLLNGHVVRPKPGLSGASISLGFKLDDRTICVLCHADTGAV